jgi:2-acylglycerol O-acyltransferase 2
MGMEIEPATKGVDGEEKLIYENVTNKSGENLTAIKPGAGYFTALEQRANKSATTEPPPEVDGRLERTQTDLVSGRRAGAGWGRSAIRWAPWNVPLQRRLQTLLVLLHTLSIAGLLAIFFFLCMIPLLWPILLPYLIYVLMSRAATDGNLSKRSEWLRQSKIWSLFGSYFPARLHRSEQLEPTRKYIFGYHPHGIISHGAFAAFATEALGFKQLFPGITNTLLTLDTNFRIPGYRDYILRMGLASVSRESCENILSKGGPNGEGMGRAITIVIGGARESLDGRPFYLRLVLKRRKGFVKLAIRNGADLVPVLAFGENDLYDQLDTNKHPIIHQLQMAVKKFMGFTVPLFHARGVFNYDVGMMPYRRPINIVVGKPIQIVQSKNPDAEYVDKIHQQYIDELVRIWEDWKDTFARHRKGELEIIE